MLAYLAVVSLLVAAPAPTTHAHTAVASAATAEDKAIKALEAWLKFYRTGKMDFRAKGIATKDAFSVKFGLVKNGLTTPTWGGDLEEILRAVVALDDEAAARAVLAVAAVGIDNGKYEYAMAPHEVRSLAETAAGRFKSAAAIAELAKNARGETKADKAQAVALQTAAVRCLGATKDKAQRPALEAALVDPDAVVRASAAEALGALDDEATAPALTAAVEKDASHAVVMAAAKALRATFGKYAAKADKDGKKDAEATNPGAGKAAESKPADGTEPAGDGANPPAKAEPTPPPAALQTAVRACIGALGRTSWRADMELVRFLDDFRTADVVPALIGVLERFAANPADVKSGKLSGLLLTQSHELLVAMTGAVYRADQPAEWRTFWETEKAKITVAQKQAPDAKKGPGTSAGGFCGIPVTGTRVVFVVDLSGSMQWPMDEDDGNGKKQRSVRLDFAKRELKRACDALPPNSQFNLVSFNGLPKSKSWRDDLVPATDKNRELFKKHVDDMRADGGTNVWAGMETALKIKSLVYGSRYDTHVDEVFVISDGAPTVGEVLDPLEILRLVQESNRWAGVRINTIFIDSATPPEARQAQPDLSIPPAELMRRMAQQNGGQFRKL
ncbi:MAG: VWA domain-containing protein [Planctomycetes bacterium]|nr:VWA domain-containing protein [Planctomycetota bacterium]